LIFESTAASFDFVQISIIFLFIEYFYNSYHQFGYEVSFMF